MSLESSLYSRIAPAEGTTYEPELLNSRCFTAVGLPTYSVQSHCSQSDESDYVLR